MIKIINESSILHATTIKVAEGLRPNRNVLRKVDGAHPYAIHRENLRFQMASESMQDIIFVHDDFYWGRYFTNLKDAKSVFYKQETNAYSVCSNGD